MDFAVPADQSVKLKEREKRDKSLDLTRELKKQWNMKVTVIPIVIGAPKVRIKGTGAKDWYKDWRTWKYKDEWRPFKSLALLRSARMLRRVLETWGDLLWFKLL